MLIPLLVVAGFMDQYSFVDNFVKKIMTNLIDDFASTISILKTSKKIFKKNFAEGKPLLEGIDELILDYFSIAQSLISKVGTGPE